MNSNCYFNIYINYITIVFARIITRFEETIFPEIINQLKTYGDKLRKIIPTRRAHILDIDLDSFQESLQNTVQLLLREFVRDQGTQLSSMIRQGIETPDWSLWNEPGDVRMAIELVSNEFTAIVKEVSEVFTFTQQEQYTSRDRYSVSTLHQLTGTPKSSFIGGHVDTNANSIVCSIIKIGLKSFIECVRLCTFNTFGYQQMQVDIEYLRFVWKELKFDSEHIIESMLDDVLESTTWRCPEPVSMGTKVKNKNFYKYYFFLNNFFNIF